MRDFLRSFEGKAKMLRCQLFPIIDCLGSRNAMKRIIDLGGGKALRVKGQHFRRRQVSRIKISLPLCVLETRCADPKFHANPSGPKIRSAKGRFKCRLKTLEASGLVGACESNMAASSSAGKI